MDNLDQIVGVPTMSQSIGGLRELIEIWDDEEGFVSVPLIDEGPLTGVAIRVLAEHAVALTKSIIVLSELDMLVQAAPLIRLTMECGITAAWFSVESKAAKAASHESDRQRRLILESMAQNKDLENEEVQIDSNGMIEGFVKCDLIAARKFEHRCNRIVGGKDLYIHYRILSQVSHAGLGLLDSYLLEVDKNSDNPIRYAFLKKAMYASAEVSLGYQVSMLCLALTAWDNISLDRPHGTRLQSVADRFGCGRNIQLIDPQISGSNG